MEFLESQFLDSLRNRFSLKVQNDATLLSHILGNRIDRLAYTHPDKVPSSIYEAAIEVNLPIIRQRPLTEGRFLMLEQFNEQTITHSYHRYGNLGLKGLNMENF